MRAWPEAPGETGDFAITLELDFNDSVLITTDQTGRTLLVFGSEVGRAIGKAVLRSYSDGVRDLAPDVVSDRVERNLRDAATRAFDVAQRDEARKVLAASVLHRLADQVKGGSVSEFTTAYAEGEICVTYKVPNSNKPARIIDLRLPDRRDSSTVDG